MGGTIAAVTERLRLAASAVIAPLRPPLLLARELGALGLLAEGRLIVLPDVSRSRDEYVTLGVPFSLRDKLLDEHLEIRAKLWGPRVSRQRALHRQGRGGGHLSDLQRVGVCSGRRG
ncbi:LLM class flavin-dependent oxidoreductase [Streptomyces sp. NPDC000658]|uniref:LLM class flavin-dependent oxidoreductase n=1 Tax=Streptomyces sp. NPDC000658 TaxID=3154266 RepID=UPI003330787A